MTKQVSITKLGAKLFQVSPEKFSDWKWQLKHQIRTAEEALKIIKLSKDEKEAFNKVEKLFNVGISPYSMALIAKLDKEGKDSNPLRLQLIPRLAELKDSRGVMDPLDEQKNSPVKEVVRAYPDRVAFCVAQLCPVYCRYCYRKRRDEETGLHYNRKIIENGIKYIASQPEIKDVLITGGDPFIANDESIEDLLKKLRAIPHVEIIRFGTRTPVAMPQRITDKFVNILKKYHPIWLNTHFNHHEELTEESCEALNKLANAGIPLGNQSVLLKGVNDNVESMKLLCQKLIRNRIRPYYIFFPHMIEGTEHLRVHYKKGIEIVRGLRGKISGFGIPNYIIDTPSGKLPISYNHIIKEEGNDLILEDLNGKPWREVDALL